MGAVTYGRPRLFSRTTGPIWGRLYPFVTIYPEAVNAWATCGRRPKLNTPIG